jgi:hypothetical protein
MRTVRSAWRPFCPSISTRAVPVFMKASLRADYGVDLTIPLRRPVRHLAVHLVRDERRDEPRTPAAQGAIAEVRARERRDRGVGGPNAPNEAKIRRSPACEACMLVLKNLTAKTSFESLSGWETIS